MNKIVIAEMVLFDANRRLTLSVQTVM